MSAPTTLPPHPLADLLPPMSQAEYEELRELNPYERTARADYPASRWPRP